MIAYIVISCILLALSIAMLIEDDLDSAKFCYPPELGYNFKDENGKFRISSVAWAFMLGVAPFTNMVVMPCLMLLMLFVKREK